MKVVRRNAWVSALLLIVAFLAITPTSLISTAAIIEPTIIPPISGETSSTHYFTERSGPIFTYSYSSSHHTSIIPITIPTNSIYLFDYTLTMNADSICSVDIALGSEFSIAISSEIPSSK